jgi:hypothetical protein
MSTFLNHLNARLPFDKTERIIIGIVIALHLLFLIGFQSSMKPDNDNNLDDARVMANRSKLNNRQLPLQHLSNRKVSHKPRMPQLHLPLPPDLAAHRFRLTLVN